MHFDRIEYKTIRQSGRHGPNFAIQKIYDESAEQSASPRNFKASVLILLN